MKVRLKNVLLFVIIICMFAICVVIMCRHKWSANENNANVIDTNNNSDVSDQVLEDERTTKTKLDSFDFDTILIEMEKNNKQENSSYQINDELEWDITNEVIEIIVENETVEKNREIIVDITEEFKEDTDNEKNEEDNELESDSVDSNLVSLGEFRLTAYCNCSQCCGKWAGGATASGVMPTANHTIAVDTSVIPFGTQVVINGNTYVAEDTGSAINGNRIDIYMSNHQEAMDFGVKYAEIFKVIS